MVPVVVWRDCYGKSGPDKRRPDERRIRNLGRLSHRAVRDTRHECLEREKGTIGGIGVAGRCSLDRTKPDPEEGVGRRWTDGDFVGRYWENKRWRWKGNVGGWKKRDKDTGSEDK